VRAGHASGACSHLSDTIKVHTGCAAARVSSAGGGGATLTGLEVGPLGKGDRSVKIDEVAERLAAAGYAVTKRTRLGNDLGDQLRLDGAVVNVWDKGTVLVQGGNKQLVGEIKGVLGLLGETDAKGAAAGNREVFVVYGHDQDARDQLEAMLRRWKLEPLILDQLPSGGATIIEKLEQYAREDVGFAVVLATPDDEGYKRGKEDEKRFRARQNVVLELGLLLGKLGRSRIAILLRDQEHTERPSDLQGLIYLPFTDDVKEVNVLLAKEMAKQGIAIDVSKL
jgi:predicted nucleotide-binding protein